MQLCIPSGDIRLAVLLTGKQLESEGWGQEAAAAAAAAVAADPVEQIQPLLQVRLAWRLVHASSAFLAKA
jgi:hypothetical protein